MLGKMLKHEWKAMAKVLFPVNLAIVAITILGSVFLGFRIYESDSTVIQALTALSTVFYVLSLIAVSFTCVIFIGIRFYKTTYTDEGYLLHTLPVTTHEIILSKLIIGIVWNLITSLIVMLSILVLIISAGQGMSFLQGIENLVQQMSLYLSGAMFTGWIIYVVYAAIISTAYSCLWLFAGISFGQIMTKHKVVGAFLGLFIIYFLMQTISTIMVGILGFTSLNNQSLTSINEIYQYITMVYTGAAVVTTVFVVALYFFTNHMMKRQLNLD